MSGNSEVRNFENSDAIETNEIRSRAEQTSPILPVLTGSDLMRLYYLIVIYGIQNS